MVELQFVSGDLDRARESVAPAHRMIDACGAEFMVANNLQGVKKGAYSDATDDRAGGLQLASAAGVIAFLSNVEHFTALHWNIVEIAAIEGRVSKLGDTTSVGLVCPIVLHSTWPLALLGASNVIPRSLHKRIKLIPLVPWLPIGKEKEKLLTVPTTLVMQYGCAVVATALNEAGNDVEKVRTALWRGTRA